VACKIRCCWELQDSMFGARPSSGTLPPAPVHDANARNHVNPLRTSIRPSAISPSCLDPRPGWRHHVWPRIQLHPDQLLVDAKSFTDPMDAAAPHQIVLLCLFIFWLHPARSSIFKTPSFEVCLYQVPTSWSLAIFHNNVLTDMVAVAQPPQVIPTRVGLVHAWLHGRPHTPSAGRQRSKEAVWCTIIPSCLLATGLCFLQSHTSRRHRLCKHILGDFLNEIQPQSTLSSQFSEVSARRRFDYWLLNFRLACRIQESNPNTTSLKRPQLSIIAAPS